MLTENQKTGLTPRLKQQLPPWSVNLPLPGFVGSINVPERIMNELIQRGVIARPSRCRPRVDRGGERPAQRRVRAVRVTEYVRVRPRKNDLPNRHAP
jgi:hypothetical protein